MIRLITNTCSEEELEGRRLVCAVILYSSVMAREWVLWSDRTVPLLLLVVSFCVRA